MGFYILNYFIITRWKACLIYEWWVL